MKPVPPPLTHRTPEPPPRLIFTTDRRQEMNQHVAQFLVVDDELPDAETYPEPFLTIAVRPKFDVPYQMADLDEPVSQYATYSVRHFKKEKTIVYGMIFWGWRELT